MQTAYAGWLVAKQPLLLEVSSIQPAQSQCVLSKRRHARYAVLLTGFHRAATLSDLKSATRRLA